MSIHRVANQPVVEFDRIQYLGGVPGGVEKLSVNNLNYEGENLDYKQYVKDLTEIFTSYSAATDPQTKTEVGYTIIHGDFYEKPEDPLVAIFTTRLTSVVKNEEFANQVAILTSKFPDLAFVVVDVFGTNGASGNLPHSVARNLRKTGSFVELGGIIARALANEPKPIHPSIYLSESLGERTQRGVQAASELGNCVLSIGLDGPGTLDVGPVKLAYNSLVLELVSGLMSRRTSKDPHKHLHSEVMAAIEESMGNYSFLSDAKTREWLKKIIWFKLKHFDEVWGFSNSYRPGIEAVEEDLSLACDNNPDMKNTVVVPTRTRVGAPPEVIDHLIGKLSTRFPDHPFEVYKFMSGHCRWGHPTLYANFGSTILLQSVEYPPNKVSGLVSN